MDGLDRSSPPAAPGGGLDAGGPLAGEQDALAGEQPNQGETGGELTQPDVQEPGEYAADALYAIPQQTSASVGEAVRIVVATGVPANPFQYMNGVRVTFSAGEPSYVAGSYNVGAVGGAADYADGIWADVNPASILLPTDYMLSFNNYNAATGGWAMDFNVTPIQSTPASGAEGALFNFEVTFAQAGSVRLGFEQFNGVDRTYFSHEESRFGTVYEHYWGDLSNDHAGVANTIEVTN